ncbi:hypothetical protein [Vibrio variabilis]|uniref:hypothetical protein n=1 Tax=Vibrio variabilis TaxID=990271 RepID=UPI003B832E92
MGFDYHLDAKRRKYTPAFLVTYNDTYQSFYDSKPKSIAENEEFKETFLQKKKASRV